MTPAACEPTPIPTGAGRLLARALEPFYAAAIDQRNRRFDAGRGVRRLPIPVISVGNLSVGGTGKTPTVAWLVRALADRGVACAIALRGYSKGRDARSDEADEYRRLLPGVPLAVGADRSSTITALLATPRPHLPAASPIRAVILDDGFQHRALHRELDIVLLDATRSPFDDRLLPAGWLREPTSSLARAHAIVATHGESAAPGGVESLLTRAATIAPRALLAASGHAWDGLTVTDPAGGEHSEHLAWLAPQRALVVCGIGNPGPFLHAAARAATLAGEIVLADHHPYPPATIARIAAAAAAHHATVLLTTEKDWSKLGALADPTLPRRLGIPIARPRLSLRFDGGEAELVALALRVIGEVSASPSAPRGEQPAAAPPPPTAR